MGTSADLLVDGSLVIQAVFRSNRQKVGAGLPWGRSIHRRVI